LELNRFSSYTQKDVDFLKWRIENPYIYYRTHKLFPFIFQYQPSAVLEVGCGSGIFLSEAIRNAHVKAVGIDFSTSHIRFAKENFPHIGFCVTSVEQLPFNPF
jgi:ubiquinone/menaquinone biosynthesis C-methylase UbiE